jgi:hypothetical protein
MSTTYLELQRIDAPSKPASRRCPALTVLMDFYEGTDDLAGEESEVELMIQLSGMTSGSVLAIDMSEPHEPPSTAIHLQSNCDTSGETSRAIALQRRARPSNDGPGQVEPQSTQRSKTIVPLAMKGASHE